MVMGWIKTFKPSFNKIILSIVLFIIFGHIPLMPCLKFPIIPDPPYTWSLCPLNPLPLIGIAGGGQSYFGLTGISCYQTTKLMMIPFAFIISYLLSAFILEYYYAKKKKNFNLNK